VKMLDRTDVKYFKLAVGLDRIGKETDIDISARCPVCGDSHTNKRMKRLHLYQKNSVTNVSCFNGDCPVHNKTVYSFLRDFFPSLVQQYRKETFGKVLTKIASGDVFEQFLSKNNEPQTELQSEVLTQDLSEFLKPIETSDKALAYVKSRGYDYDENDYGKWYYGFQDLKIKETVYRITNSIVIPLYYRNQMYGFYSRNIENKIFYTYMNAANVGYKCWNWFNIDKSEPVYIFEGIFDAISSKLKNSISLMGAKIPEDRLAELKNPVFVLDNDKTGLMNSLEYAKRRYTVYIQPEMYKEKDINDLSKRLNTKDVILGNLFSGISAEVRIKSKL